MYCRSTKIKNHLRIRHKIEQIERETLSSQLVQVRKKDRTIDFAFCVERFTHNLDINSYSRYQQFFFVLKNCNQIPYFKKFLSQVEEPEAVRNFKQMMEKMLGR